MELSERAQLLARFPLTPELLATPLGPAPNRLPPATSSSSPRDRSSFCPSLAPYRSLYPLDKEWIFGLRKERKIPAWVGRARSLAILNIVMLGKSHANCTCPQPARSLPTRGAPSQPPAIIRRLGIQQLAASIKVMDPEEEGERERGREAHKVASVSGP